MRKYYFIVLIGLLTAISTYSQEKTDSIKSVNLSTIEITGSRPGVNTPISQKTITALEIEKRYHGQEMVYVMENTPSLTTQSDGGQPNGYVSFRLRGIDQTRINMTLNGVPLNEPEDQGVYFSNYPNFAMNIKSMQIQRGIGTSSNGTASYGGSINFESNDGRDKGLVISETGGSFKSSTLTGSYATGLMKNKMSFYGSASAYSSEGYKYHSGGKGYSGFVSGGYYNGKEIIKLTAFTGLSINQMAWYAVSESDIKIDPKTNYNPKGENDKFTQSLAQLQYIYTCDDNSVFSSTLYYNRLDGKYGMFISDTDLSNITLGSNFFGSTSNYRFYAKNLTFNVGYHVNAYTRTHIGDVNDVQTYQNSGSKYDNQMYVKTEYKRNNFTFFGDVQTRIVMFEYDGDVEMKPIIWGFCNPRGGVTYSLTNKGNVYFFVGQSHREPTRSDMFGGNDNLVTLSIIKPESVIDYELGYNLKTDKIKLQTNLYFMDFKNEITLLGAVGLNSLPLMTSVDKSYRSGIEFEGTYNVSKHWSLTNNTVFTRNRILGDNKEYQPLYSPKIIVNQNIEYTNKCFYVMFGGRYLSDAYINSANTEIIPSYMIFNSTVGFTFGNLTLLAQGNNLFNKRYYTGGYVYNSDNCYYVGAPTSFYTTIKVKF